MKKLLALLLLITVLLALAGPMAVPVAAADREYTFYGTVGKTEYFIIFSDAYDEILEAKIYNGVVPGMSLDVAGGATLGLVGVPTTDGEFKVFITMKTKNLGTLDIKVTVYINPAEAEKPVVTKHPTNETVVEGESATFIAKADNARQYLWQVAIADATLDASELPDYFGSAIKVSGWNTEKLVLSNIPIELNDIYVWCQFIGAEDSIDSNAAKLTVISQKDATPIVTKDPTNETVEEGGEAVFVAKAKYAQSYLWQLVSPDGITYDCADAPESFKGLKVSGADTERIVLKNIPLELDGYRIFCRFTAGDVVSSKMAKLTVTEKPVTEPPTEQPTEEPTEATEPTTETTEPTTETAEPEPETEEQETEKKARKKRSDTSEDDSDTLIIVIILAATAVVVAGTTAFVIVKLKGGRK